ncbi:MAG: hypothetical protein OK456_06690 [Thaumarchaeota archaeon]|nr:hypothetical protein [Nitrososphaerota archaeon]
MTAHDDDFDEVFRDFRRFVRREPDSTPIDEAVFVDIPQLEGPETNGLDDELILGTDDVTYLLFAADHEPEDFIVSAEEDELVVKTPGFTVRKLLEVKVDPDETDSSYRNGVFSVKLKRRVTEI